MIKKQKQIEQWLGIKVDKIGAGLAMPEAKGKNIENMIGSLQVPMGIAGPLQIGQKKYWLPLATTEGALVASINRGCKAISLSAGLKVIVDDVGATRGPVFVVKGLEEGRKLSQWLVINKQKLNRLVQKKEKHISLKEVKSTMVGKKVYVRFVFKTDEAMGMNMVTIATERIGKLIKQELGIECVAVSGNYCVDKKASWINFIEGRGKRVWAETELKAEVVKEVLKTEPARIVEVVRAKQWLGSILSGSMGFNAHFANVVGAMFLATGQDIAHVVGASLGVTTAEVTTKNGDLYFSVYLPSLMVGTVGGGTHLPTQKQALEILGLGNKQGDAIKLAEIIGGGVLAGELSLTAALASGDLGKAHQKLGRGKRLC